ncbi:hypothetical protein D3C81_1655240 [compost metagenome]
MVNAYPVDDFAAKAGHNVKQVVDHLGIRTLLADLKIHGRVHIHGNGFDSLATFLSQPLEKWPDRLSAIAFPNPKDAHALCIQGHGSVTMPLVQSKLVHD